MGRVPSTALICSAMIVVTQAVAACASPAAPATTSEIRITPDQFGTVVNVKVGDVVVVPPPLGVAEWRVDYTSTVLQLLNPETRDHPGPDGWRFRVLAPGDAEIGLSPITTGDAPPPRLVVSLHVSQ